jgi:hypothetical protein
MLLATTQCRLHLFEGIKIFLQPVDMLLHLHNRRPEFSHRADCPARACGLL